MHELMPCRVRSVARSDLIRDRMSHIVRLNAAAKRGVDQVGAKAATLGELADRHNVPDGFVIVTRRVRRALPNATVSTSAIRRRATRERSPTARLWRVCARSRSIPSWHARCSRRSPRCLQSTGDLQRASCAVPPSEKTAKPAVLRVSTRPITTSSAPISSSESSTAGCPPGAMKCRAIAARSARTTRCGWR